MPSRRMTRPEINSETAQILSRMARGEFAAHIATELGVSKQALCERLRLGDMAEYRLAMQRGAQARLLRTMRQIRDGADVPAKRLKRELLYCQVRAPQVLQYHQTLIYSSLVQLWRRKRGQPLCKASKKPPALVPVLGYFDVAPR